MTTGPGVQPMDGPAIRRATSADAGAVADVLIASWGATFDFPSAHTHEQIRHWVAEVLLPGTETHVAVTAAGEVIGMMSLSEAMIDQLYLHPAWLGRGLGTRFVALAKARRPDGLDLYCFQANGRARRFYEARGFTAIAFGDGSGNEERQPDIRYAWRPTPAPPADR